MASKKESKCTLERQHWLDWARWFLAKAVNSSNDDDLPVGLILINSAPFFSGNEDIFPEQSIRRSSVEYAWKCRLASISHSLEFNMKINPSSPAKWIMAGHEILSMWLIWVWPHLSFYLFLQLFHDSYTMTLLAIVFVPKYKKADI